MRRVEKIGEVCTTDAKADDSIKSKLVWPLLPASAGMKKKKSRRGQFRGKGKTPEATCEGEKRTHLRDPWELLPPQKKTLKTEGRSRRKTKGGEEGEGRRE